MKYFIYVIDSKKKKKRKERNLTKDINATMKSDFVNTMYYRMEERRGIWVKFHGWRSEIAQREKE